jgi:hypothetical protein
MAERATPAFTRHVRDVWPPDELPKLIEAAEAVERLLAHPGWNAIQEVISREIAMIDQVLDDGPVRDAGHYAKAHGRRGALRGAQQAAEAIMGEAARQHAQAEALLQVAA